MIKKRKIIKISWNRKEVLDIYDTYKNKYEQYLANACSLKVKFYKFAHLDVRDIKHLICHVTLNESTTELECSIDRKRTYNDCNIVSAMDHHSQLQQL